MNWLQLLSLKRFGDTEKRLRNLQDESRLGFEVDNDRILFSDSFRSLQDKTQVIPLSQTDFVHTRLTHSLEVSVVARSIGRIVGEHLLQKYPEIQKEGYLKTDFGTITAAAALAHDIGNPPFGHSGEKAIGEFFNAAKGKEYQSFLTDKQWQDLIDFEGNANGFKILTDNSSGAGSGLRLSYATLGAFIKYPKESLPKKPTSNISDKKFGIFQSEIPVFEDLTKELGLIKSRSDQNIAYHRHPLAFIVEAADDICYTIIDFEDGINLGLIDEEHTLEFFIKLVKDTIDTKKYYTLNNKQERIKYLRALAINVLINEAAAQFIKNESEILAGNFHSSLMDRCKYEAQMKDIIIISNEKIYQSKEVIEKEIAGYKIIGDLLTVFCKAVINDLNHEVTSYDKLIYKLLPAKMQELPKNYYDRLLAVSSFVASMSDSYAILLHRKISGNSF
ncbi:MAG TPA: deoxyguanosinetriphosphate triphosphohydrolase [Flavobacteriaceae bacterium]|nr:deoxyguanosinetriphosphate triphosphohydrolase [Flavobacteriaceae bacterium]HEX5743604.1 deoxyguanosinetriphosphate triphosphohydrolase [Flavobacteriaceae bacterium]